MPYILPDIPVGIGPTGKFVMEIAEYFGLQEEAKKLIAREEAKLEKALIPIKEKVKGKKVIISGGYLRIGTTGLLAKEIGMEVVGFRNFNYDSFGNKLFSEIEETIGDVSNSISTQPSELLNVLRRLKPDMAISHPGVGVWLTKAGIPSITLFAQRFPILGYKGAYDLSRRIARTITNPNYAKNLGKHVHLPFKDEWYRKDPYFYINDKNANIE